MRRAVLVLLAVVLVNLPWAHDAYVQHELDSSGIPATAILVKHSEAHGSYFVAYRFDKAIDPRQRQFEVEVTASAYRAAVATGRLSATILRGNAAANRVVGEVTGSLVIVIAAVGDAIILLMLGFVWMRRRRWSRFKVIAVDDDGPATLVTIVRAGRELTVELADDPATSQRLRPRPGSTVRGVLYLVPDEDVVPGPPLGEFSSLGGTTYRVAGRVRSMTSTRTVLTLEDGFPLLVCGDEVEHVAELKGSGSASGTLKLASQQPM